MTSTQTEFRAGTVGEVMTPGVLTCQPATPLRDVARMMVLHRVHAIVVFGGDDGLRPWGVVSDLDLISAIGTNANAGSIAASPVVSVPPESALEEAAASMAENQTSHLLVVSGNGLPIGVVSTLDLARSLGGEDDPGRT